MGDLPSGAVQDPHCHSTESLWTVSCDLWIPWDSPCCGTPLDALAMSMCFEVSSCWLFLQPSRLPTRPYQPVPDSIYSSREHRAAVSAAR